MLVGLPYFFNACSISSILRVVLRAAFMITHTGNVLVGRCIRGSRIPFSSFNFEIHGPRFLNPDAVLKTTLKILEMEQALKR
jgi:hypothetical protein